MEHLSETLWSLCSQRRGTAVPTLAMLNVQDRRKAVKFSAVHLKYNLYRRKKKQKKKHGTDGLDSSLLGLLPQGPLTS